MLNDLLTRNVAWSKARHTDDPDLFSRLAGQQAPAFFRIGCSDRDVPANVVAWLDPGEVFVHHNAANAGHPSDMNLLSALEFTVGALKLREIIACGHFGDIEAWRDKLAELNATERVRRVKISPMRQKTRARGASIRVHLLISVFKDARLRYLDFLIGPGHNKSGAAQ